jgi:MFS family permease
MLFACTALLGTSQIFITISMQTVSARIAPPGKLAGFIGNYLMANVIGQSIGPYVVGWAGGSASIPPTQFLFELGIGSGLLTFATLLMLRPAKRPAGAVKATKPISLREAIRLPGLPVVFLASVATTASQDLLLVYMPLLGAERGLTVADVGVLLAIRALSSMLSRMFFGWSLSKLGHQRFLLLSTFGSAAGYLALAVPLPLVAMGVTISVLGAALGTSITLSIARALAISSAETRGTVNSLRIMGNRGGQMVMPTLAGLFAAAAGISATFVVIGAFLAVVTGVVRLAQPKSTKSPS